VSNPGVNGCQVINVLELESYESTISPVLGASSSSNNVLKEQIDNCDNIQDKKNWTDAETCVFLQICKEEKVTEISCKERIPHKWQKVSQLLKERIGCVRSKEVCKNKWGRLKKDFLKWKSQQSQTGEARVPFKFRDEMEDLLGDKHHVQPKVLLSATGILSGHCASTSSDILPQTNILSSPKANISTSVPVKRKIDCEDAVASSCMYSPTSMGPSAKKRKPSFESSVSVLLQKQNDLLEANKQQMEAMTKALDGGLHAIADAIRYFTDHVNK
jgi:hypothetical protein